MTTWTAQSVITGEAAAAALAEAVEDALEPFGVGHYEIEDGSGLFEVGAHFEVRPDGVALDLLAAAHGARAFVVSEVPPTDWVAHVRRELAPVAAGRFFVYGAHDADKVPADAVPLLIEASMAFGTGHHGTTLGCLQALDRLAGEGRHFARIADIGCGTAVLAMAAARIWGGPVLAGDIDPVAVEVAEANVAANALGGRVICEVAAGFDGPQLAAGGPYDLVLANILKGPLVALAPTVAGRMVAGGLAILSGLLADQAQAVETAYRRHGFDLAGSETIADWTTLLLVRIAR